MRELPDDCLHAAEATQSAMGQVKQRRTCGRAVAAFELVGETLARSNAADDARRIGERRRERRDTQSSRAPGESARPRRNSAADSALPPARCNSVIASAP